MAQRQKVSIKSGGAVILRVLAGRACREDVEEPSQMEAIALCDGRLICRLTIPRLFRIVEKESKRKGAVQFFCKLDWEGTPLY